ncbi:MAG TPA: CHASE2 domain-containing protein, partial [Verrucomicrobiae bacterium]|nr:CHASE2 domain-containing protein [Verrucomicrobiae bacterium]
MKKPVLPWVLVILSITALKEWNTAKVFKATAFFDACSILTARPEDVPQNGALVLVDESSLRSMSELHNVRWPWPRSLFAALIAALHHAGAEKILMDFTFFEKSEPEHDDVLAAYAAACEETVLARTSKQKPVIWANGIQVKYPKLFARSRTGLVDLGFDPDGVYRHYHLPGSLAAAALTNKVAYKSDMLRWHGGLGSSSVSLTNVAYAAAPFVVEGERLQRQLREKGVDETNPVEVARGLASGLPPLEERIAVEVRGKVVFVGVNAAGTGDWKAIPVGGIEPGVLVHFTAWMNALRGEFIREAPPWGDVLASVLLTSIILGFGWLRPGGAWIVAVGVGLEVALLGGIFLAFRHGWFLPPALPAASILLAMVGSVSHNFWRESERKREIQAIFGSYVSEQVVNQLLENPDAIKLGGEKKVLTVFFSDLAGFTDLSEKLSP